MTEIMNQLIHLISLGNKTYRYCCSTITYHAKHRMRFDLILVLGKSGAEEAVACINSCIFTGQFLAFRYPNKMLSINFSANAMCYFWRLALTAQVYIFGSWPHLQSKQNNLFLLPARYKLSVL